MTRKVEYTFKIEGLTPAEMPFARLVEYYAQLKTLIGVGENVHLVDIKESSHASCLTVDQQYEKKLLKRISDVKSGSAPVRVKRAQDMINAMLREDDTSGAFIGPQLTNVIDFPGNKIKEEVVYEIRDVGTFTGELYHIAGSASGEEVNLRIRTDAYGVVFALTTKDKGRVLREFLFENLQVTGKGLWRRDAAGRWAVDDFEVLDFAPARKETLRDTVNRLRKLDIQWPSDPLGEIECFNEADEVIH